MNLRSRRSVTVRVVGTLGLVTSLVLLAAFALFFTLLDRQLTQAQERGLEVRSDYLAAAVRAGDTQAVARDPLAQLYGPKGEVVVGSTALVGRRLLGEAEAVRADQRGATRTVTLETAGTGPIRLWSVALGPDLGVLTVGVSAEPVERAHRRLVLLVLIAGPTMLALVLLAGWRAVRAALAPVERIRMQAEAISSLDSRAKLSPVPGQDEIARLAQTLDGMLDRLHVAFDRERAFVDDASHELRTPIAVMRGELELAAEAVADGDRAGLDRALRAARSENERLERLAEDLLLLARERAGTLVVRAEPVDLLDLCWSEALRLGELLGLGVHVDGDPAVVSAGQPLAQLRDSRGSFGAHRSAGGRRARRAGRSRRRAGFPRPRAPHRVRSLRPSRRGSHARHRRGGPGDGHRPCRRPGARRASRGRQRPAAGRRQGHGADSDQRSDIRVILYDA
ncbi:MAG: histidine kinase dimerization/phospho-acceptor domain-containing protein [Sporichthyaceae bacterium]